MEQLLFSPELIVRPRAEIPLTQRGFPPRPTIAPAIGILADTAANDLLKQLVDAWFGGSAKRAARSLGLDVGTVYRYLSGKRSVPRRLAMQLAAVRADREQDVKRRAKARLIAEHIRSAEDNARLAPAGLALRRLLEVTKPPEDGRGTGEYTRLHHRALHEDAASLSSQIAVGRSDCSATNLHRSGTDSVATISAQSGTSRKS